MAKDVKREITILSNLKHGGIIQLLGSFEENNHQYLVLEHSAGGDLFDKIGTDLCLFSAAVGSTRRSPCPVHCALAADGAWQCRTRASRPSWRDSSSSKS